MEKEYLTLGQIGIYNPLRQTDEISEKLFSVRTAVLDFLMKKIEQEKPNSIPQLHLIIAQRGMGKTTLLKRIEVELRKDKYNKKFIPLIFPEEQYNLTNLAEFWLNALDALADTLEQEKQQDVVNQIDTRVKQLSTISDAEEKSNQAYDYLISISKSLSRRPVMLIDNLSLVFDRLSKDEQHVLRALLMQNDAPVIIAASAINIDETVEYGAPFYDAFQMHYLHKLTFEELLHIINNLAELTNATNVNPEIHREIGKLKTLHQLTGGNPRTAVMLFRIILKGFSNDINNDLEALLDEITPLYKARFEELSPQLQIIVDAIALNWNPITLEQLRTETGFDNGQLSPQLKRLVETGWIEKLNAYKTKGNAYQISERFFNIWFLMRRSSRRKKEKLNCLTKFLETLYSSDDLNTLAINSLKAPVADIHGNTLNLALADALKDENLKLRLKIKSYDELSKQSELNPDILNEFDFPKADEQEINELINKHIGFKKQKDYSRCENVLLDLELKSINNKYFRSRILNDSGNLYQNHLKKYDQSEKAYKKAIEIDKDFASPWNGLGNLYQNYLKKYDQAEEAYKKAIEIDKDLASPWNGLGNLYQDYLKKYDKAEETYKKAIEIDKDFASPWNGLGNLYKNYLKKYDKAEEAYKKAIEIDKDDASPWNGLGNLYQNHLKKYDQSEKAYKKAIEIDKDLAYPWNGLGNLYQNYLKKYDQSEEAYKKAIEIDKDLAYPWNGLGNLYQNYLKKYDQSEEAYKKAIEIDKDFASPWNGLGNLYQDYLKKYDKAEESYKKAIEIDKDYAWNGLGNLYQYYLKKYDQSEEAYKKAIEINNDDANAWCNLGNLYKDYLKMYEQAENSYKKAIEIDKKDVSVWYNLGNLYQINLKKFDEAEATYKAAIEIDKGDALTWNSLGNLYQDHLKKYKDAEECYLKAIKLDENILFPKYNLVFLYRDKLNKIKEAEALFSTINFDKELEDSYWLNKALFELYKKNEGIATEYLQKAVDAIDNGFNPNTQDDWWRLGAVINKLGYNNWFLNLMEQHNLDKIIAPYYVAIVAMSHPDEESYLNSVAVEIREPAKQLIDIMRKYVS